MKSLNFLLWYVCIYIDIFFFRNVIVHWLWCCFIQYYVSETNDIQPMEARNCLVQWWIFRLNLLILDVTCYLMRAWFIVCIVIFLILIKSLQFQRFRNVVGETACIKQVDSKYREDLHGGLYFNQIYLYIDLHDNL